MGLILSLLLLAGDIFLRPQDEVEVKEDKIDYSSEDFRTMFKVSMLDSHK